MVSKRILCLFLASAMTSLSSAEVTVTSAPFGKTKDGVDVKKFTIKNDHGLEVGLIELGATIQSLVVPDRDGNGADIVLGFDDVAGYQSDDNPYFGCTTGRYANRIANAKFTLDGETYELAANNGDHHLHGGEDKALSRVVWKGKPVDAKGGKGVEFSYVSPDGEEGYPGKLNTRVRFVVLEKKNQLRINYFAKTNKNTVLNLTNHSYFNLLGGATGGEGTTVKDHRLMVNADHWTPTDDELIPTGEIAPVEGTPYDFRKPTKIGKNLMKAGFAPNIGYDMNFVLNKQKDEAKGLNLAARVTDPDTGRTITVRTKEPGIQLYTGVFLDGSFTGKNDTTYPQYGAFCLETQVFPDTPNHDNFPTAVVTPEKPYNTTTTFDFGVVKAAQKKQAKQ